MVQTKYSRKLEQNGRLMIPVKLREEVNLQSGKEYQFFLHSENGHRFICIDCGPEFTTDDIDKAVQLLQKAGVKFVENDD